MENLPCYLSQWCRISSIITMTWCASIWWYDMIWLAIFFQKTGMQYELWNKDGTTRIGKGIPAFSFSDNWSHITFEKNGSWGSVLNPIGQRPPDFEFRLRVFFFFFFFFFCILCWIDSSPLCVLNWSLRKHRKIDGKKNALVGAAWACLWWGKTYKYSFNQEKSKHLLGETKAASRSECRI